MKHKFLLFSTLFLTFGLVSCNELPVPGPAGPEGPKGESGADILTGNFDPGTYIGKSGDVYINTITWDFFLRVGNAWILKGNLKGEDGNDGSDGHTPYIGTNGNWWINGKDSGIKADTTTPDQEFSDGFSFEVQTLNGEIGYVATKYNGADTNVIMPDYIGSLPVIGTNDNIFNSNITSLKLSKNTNSLGSLENNTDLTHIDFNSCKLKTIEANTFKNTGLRRLSLPDEVSEIQSEAFYGCPLNYVDFNNVRTIGTSAFKASKDLYSKTYYVPQTVTNIAEDAFYGNIVYFEIERKPSSYTFTDYENYLYNIKKSKEYFYSTDHLNETTIYKYFGSENEIKVPSTINGTDAVTKIGLGAFNSLDTSTVSFKSITLPETTNEILDGAFIKCKCAYIYIPRSVYRIESYAFSNLGEYLPNQLYLFGGDSVITLANTPDYYYLNVNSSDFSINDGGLVLWRETQAQEYSIISTINNEFNPEIADVHNGFKITKVKKHALHDLDIVVLGTNINKVENEGIINCDMLYIRSNVQIINYQGVSNVNFVFIEGESVSSDWDSSWNYQTQSINYNVIGFGIKDEFKYFKTLDCLAIVGITPNYIENKYTDIKIPREIDGTEVTKICTHSLRNIYGDLNIYIPEEVYIIENYAFYDNGHEYTINFYVERNNRPGSWYSNWNEGAFGVNNRNTYYGRHLNY